MKKLSLETFKDKRFGKKGTPKRNAYDSSLKAFLEASFKRDTISVKIKELRKSRGLTQTELGKLLGIDKTQISKIEGGTTNLTIESMERIFDALQVSAKLVFEEKEEVPVT